MPAAGDLLVAMLYMITPPGLWISIIVIFLAALVLIYVGVRRDRRRVTQMMNKLKHGDGD